MLIMSQDRKRIVNIDNASTIVICNEWNNGKVRIEASDIHIGTYETIDKAKAVLEEILTDYKHDVRTFDMPDYKEDVDND